MVVPCLQMNAFLQLICDNAIVCECYLQRLCLLKFIAAILPALTGAQHPVDPSPAPANNPAGHIHLVCVCVPCAGSFQH